MATEFKLPDLGEGVKGGDVVAVHVAAGDTVKAEQTLLELETDKAVLEVPSPQAGKVSAVHFKQGDHLSIGQLLVTFDGAGAGSSSASAAAADSKPPAKAPPRTPPSSAKAEPAAKPAPAAKAETPAKPAPAAGPPPAATTPKDRPAPASPKMPPLVEPVAAGPATRRLARELGVELSEVAAAFPGERLSEDHVKLYVRQSTRAAEQTSPAPTAAPVAATSGAAAMPGTSAVDLPDFAQWGPIERVPFSSLQRKIATNLQTGWHLAPHVTQFDEADVTALEALRRRFRDTPQAKQVKLTVTAFIIKAVTIALKAQPQFNASLDDRTNELVYKKYYHVGVAVDTEAGLIVPVLRDADVKSVLQIAREMNDLAERTRIRKVGLDELRGGSFTVTNLGGIGGTAFTPIINYPEVAILGVARGREVPYIKDGQLASKLMLPLCLSYDHRVINGADGARFLRKVADLLEDPEMLLLGA